MIKKTSLLIKLQSHTSKEKLFLHSEYHYDSAMVVKHFANIVIPYNLGQTTNNNLWHL